MVVVLRLPADVDQPVDGAGAAERAAARPGKRRPSRLGSGSVCSPSRGRVVDGLEVAGRDVQPHLAVRAAGLEQQHRAPPVLAQPVGENAAGRSGADDDEVERLRRIPAALPSVVTPLRRDGRLLRDEPLVLQLRPEVGGDRPGQVCDVRLHLGAAHRRRGGRSGSPGWASGNCSAAAGMSTPWRAHIAASACTLVATASGTGAVVVARLVAEPDREHAGIEWAAEDDCDVLLHAERQQFGERVLLQQRVAAGEQDAVDVGVAREAQAHLRLVQPDADRRDRAGGAQRLQRRDSSRRAPRR